LIYGTSRDFLELFGLSDLNGLPSLKEFSDLSPELTEELERQF
jgi:segregation and condensation protein B